MARITVEDCLEHVPNRFALVLVAADRAKDLLRKTVNPLIEDHRDNKEVVTALREIADGVVRIKDSTLKLRSPDQGDEEIQEDAEILDSMPELGLEDLEDLDMDIAEF